MASDPLRSGHESADWNATWNGVLRCRRRRNRRRTYEARRWPLGRMLRRSRRWVHRATPIRVVPGICDHVGPRTLAACSRPQRRPNVPDANRALLGGRCCVVPTRCRADALTALRADRCAGLPPRRTLVLDHPFDRAVDELDGGEGAVADQLGQADGVMTGEFAHPANLTDAGKPRGTRPEWCGLVCSGSRGVGDVHE